MSDLNQSALRAAHVAYLASVRASLGPSSVVAAIVTAYLDAAPVHEARHVCEDGADRALAVVDALPSEHRPATLRLIRDAIDQRIGVRAKAAPKAPKDVGEALFKTTVAA